MFGEDMPNDHGENTAVDFVVVIRGPSVKEADRVHDLEASSLYGSLPQCSKLLYSVSPLIIT